MGQPKLLLPFGGEPLIGRVVKALLDGGAGSVIVVSPPADQPEGPPVAEAARRAGATVITPVKHASRDERIGRAGARRARPRRSAAGVLLTPGDSPALTPAIVRQVLGRWAGSPESIVIPVAGGKQTHPIVLPWDLALEIRSLPRIISASTPSCYAHPDRVVEIGIATPELAENLNTPEDLERWQARQKSTVIRAALRRRQGAGRQARGRGRDCRCPRPFATSARPSPSSTPRSLRSPRG